MRLLDTVKSQSKLVKKKRQETHALLETNLRSVTLKIQPTTSIYIWISIRIRNETLSQIIQCLSNLKDFNENSIRSVLFLVTNQDPIYE